MLTPVTAAVDALAAFRVARLVIDDAVTDPARGALLRVAGRAGGVTGRHAAAELLGCYWCVGVWAGLAVVAARAAAPRLWGDVLGPALAFSAVTGLLGTRNV